MPTAAQWFVSVMIVLSGVWGGHALTKVDQDLRIIYTEYTLAATDLGHMNARLIRYRTTILRAIGANTERQFENIVESLPEQSRRIEATIERYMEATKKAPSHLRGKDQETAALIELREKLDQYIEASHHTIELVRHGWRAGSRTELQRAREAAERYAAEQAGPKLVAVSFALDRMLEIVAEIAGEARSEAESILRLATSVVIGISVVLVAFVVSLPVRGRP